MHRSVLSPSPSHLQRGGYSTANARALGSSQNDSVKTGKSAVYGLTSGGILNTPSRPALMSAGLTVTTGSSSGIDQGIIYGYASFGDKAETRPINVTLHPRIQI